MQRTLIPLSCLLILSAACSGDAPTAPPFATVADADAAVAVARPARGTCTTTVSVVEPGPVLILAIEGVCNLAHAGRSAWSTIQSVNTATGAFTHEGVYTTANGDKLYTTFDGQVTGSTPTGLTFIGTETYTGGTGRFEGASGSSTARGSSTHPGPSGAVGEFSTRGTIIY